MDDRGSDFAVYEYKSITVKRDMVEIYEDCYKSFGWRYEGRRPSMSPVTSVDMKFKRDRRILNKMELTRLQRQFEGHMNEISKLEMSKSIASSVVAYIVGIVGTAFMAGSVMSITAERIPLSIILAIPAIIGWVLPYFLYKSIYNRKESEVTPLVEQHYDEIYEICEKANTLCYK